MVEVIEVPEQAIGEVIFRAGVTFATVKQFAQDLKNSEDGSKYKLYIRPKRHRWILGFMHECGAGEEAQSKFYYKFTDMIQRRFGSNIHGWSISGPIWIID